VLGLSESALGALCALTCALSWAVIGLFVRALSASFNSITLNAARSAVGGAIILAWVLATDGLVALTAMSGTAWILLSVSVVMAVGLGDTVFFESTRMLGLARAMTVSMTYPLVAALMAAAILGEPLTPRIWLGALLTFTGVTLTVRSQPVDGARTSQFWPGVAAATLASLAWAISLILLKPTLAEVDAVRAQAVRLPVAAALLWATPWTWSAAASIGRHRAKALWLLLALGVLTAASSVLFVAGVRYAGVAVGAVLSSTSPLFAAPLGWLFLGERATPAAVLGAVVTIAGIAVLQS